jgi:serine/threonine protein kinase
MVAITLPQKKSSDPSYGKDGSDTEDHITRNIGTRLFASPEQWMADKDTFDYRADIFSLGVTFLLLFHPMSTYMERNDMIQDSKDGKIPESLEKELPEIAGIIKKMLSLDPSARPSILEIIQSLKLPCEIRSQLQGSISFRRENALRWRNKYFKLIDSNLYLYNKETDKKAENIYTLFQWKVTREFVEEDPKSRGSAHKGESEGEFRMNGLVHDSGDMCIKLENSDQLGCELKLEDSNAMEELFKAFEKYKGAY